MANTGFTLEALSAGISPASAPAMIRIKVAIRIKLRLTEGFLKNSVSAEEIIFKIAIPKNAPKYPATVVNNMDSDKNHTDDRTRICTQCFSDTYFFCTLFYYYEHDVANANNTCYHTENTNHPSQPIYDS